MYIHSKICIYTYKYAHTHTFVEHLKMLFYKLMPLENAAYLQFQTQGFTHHTLFASLLSFLETWQ